MAIGFPVKDDYVTGEVLTAANMNDLSGTLNTLSGTQEAAGFAAGKNKIINGDFGVWQRGAGAFTSDGVYSADRYNLGVGGSGTLSVTRETFTPGTAPVSGYESQYFMQAVTASTSGTTDYKIVSQYIEDVRTFAGQTTTFSFWAKAASGTPKIAIEAFQSFGSGGSSNVFTYGGQVTLSTSWTRYTLTIAIPSVSGKTIGAGSFLGMRFWLSAGSDFNSRTGSLGNQNATFQIWGVQHEQGSTATSFQTATGTIQGELAACQRYYYRNFPAVTDIPLGQGSANGTRYILAVIALPVSMRVAPTSAEFSALKATDGATAASTVAALASYGNSPTTATYYFDCTSGLTQFRNYKIETSSSAGYLGFSAEL
jgi:hypothetical protein